MDANCSYSHGFGQSQYHVVLVPYRRRKMFARADIRTELVDKCFAIASQHGFELKEIEVMDEHVHLFVSIRPSQSISQVIQFVKGASSRHLRSMFPELVGFHRSHLWSKGKFFRPIGEVNEATIRHYIEESQGKHDDRKERTWLPDLEPERATPQRSMLDYC